MNKLLKFHYRVHPSMRDGLIDSLPYEDFLKQAIRDEKVATVRVTVGDALLIIFTPTETFFSSAFEATEANDNCTRCEESDLPKEES